MIKGRLINLRTMRSKDLEAFWVLASDLENRGPHYPTHLPTETSIKARFEKDGYWSEDSGTMLITNKEDDQILGMIVFFKTVHYYSGVEVGYILFDQSSRGKGYTTEAVKLFSQYLFSWLPINRLQIQTEPDNLASRKVAEKCGYIYEGTARNAITTEGEAKDMVIYSLLRTEAALL